MQRRFTFGAMVKRAFLLVLSFSYIVLNGSSRLYTTLQHTFTNYLSASCNNHNTPTLSEAVNSKQSFHQPADAGTEEEQLTSIEPEDDDDNLKAASRKCPDLTGYFPALLYACLSDDTHQYRKAQSSHCTHFAVLSTNRYLLYRSIRI